MLERLAKRDNLLICEDEIEGYWGQLNDDPALDPGHLTCEKAALNFTMTSDGGAEIEPTVVYDSLPERREYVAVRDFPDNSSWRIVTISKEYRTAAKALARQTRAHALKIPAAGLEKLESLFAQVADRAPVAWRQGAASVRKDVPRETAVPKPCVRVTFADDTLSVSLVVRLLEEPLWTAEPGKGVPERLVVAKDASKKLIVRDFAAETTAVAPAREVLKPFDEAAVDEAHWYFSGLTDSLAALGALHAAAAEEKFALEWPEGETLQLTQLVSHSARYEGGTTAEEWLSVSGSFDLDDGKGKRRGACGTRSDFSAFRPTAETLNGLVLPRLGASRGFCPCAAWAVFVSFTKSFAHLSRF